MGFDIPAEAYDRFMGRYSSLLSPKLADFAGVRSGQRVLDVGCGPGALTAELVARLGADAVAAVDPSVSFVEAARERYPEVDIREAKAESLPFPDDAFDAALAQLVVHFMKDPVAGLTEMRRVVRSGGVVAATVWDFVGEATPTVRSSGVVDALAALICPVSVSYATTSVNVPPMSIDTRYVPMSAPLRLTIGRRYPGTSARNCARCLICARSSRREWHLS